MSGNYNKNGSLSWGAWSSCFKLSSFRQTCLITKKIKRHREFLYMYVTDHPLIFTSQLTLYTLLSKLQIFAAKINYLPLLDFILLQKQKHKFTFDLKIISQSFWTVSIKESIKCENCIMNVCALRQYTVG